MKKTRVELNPIGTKINFLIIKKYIEIRPVPTVLCKCVCGKDVIVLLSNILPRKDRVQQSCGCMRGKLVSIKNTKHGMTNTSFYKRWRSMFDRTTSEKYVNREWYKNIKVCSKWKDFLVFKKDMYESYLKHVKDFGERQTTLDRIDVTEGYSKSNCRWATTKEQSLNKTNTAYVLKNGVRIPLLEYCRENGVAIWSGYKYLKGKSVESYDLSSITKRK